MLPAYWSSVQQLKSISTRLPRRLPRTTFLTPAMQNPAKIDPVSPPKAPQELKYRRKTQAEPNALGGRWVRRGKQASNRLPPSVSFPGPPWSPFYPCMKKGPGGRTTGKICYPCTTFRRQASKILFFNRRLLLGTAERVEMLLYRFIDTMVVSS